MRKCENCGANLGSGERCDCEMEEGRSKKMELEKMLREMIQQAVDKRINDAAVSDVDEFTTMSFEIRKTHLKKLRDYAFTNRLKIKEALDEVLAQYLDPIDDSSLMEYPEKPKKTRKRG